MATISGVLVALMVWVTRVKSEQINYFGVAYSPYVKYEPYPNWDTYGIEEIKQMLRIVNQDNRHNAIATYSMGVAGYNKDKPWDRADSNCLISRAAAQINRDRGAVVLSVSQGIYQQDDEGLQNREIQNAFEAVKDANGIFRGTVANLVFTNEFVTDANRGQKVLRMIREHKGRAHQMGIRVGARVHTCGEIWGGPNQNSLIQIARESDFIMCNLYPGQGANNPEQAVQDISNAYYSARDGFWRNANNRLEVMIGETGWASEGQTFNNAVNNVENQRRFWEGMRNWSQNNRVKVFMFEAINEPWKPGGSGEKHFGWWYRKSNAEAVYVEKATGRVFS